MCILIMSPTERIMSKFKCCIFVLLTVLCTRCDSQVQKNGAPVHLPNPEQNVMPYEPVQYSQANISDSYRSSSKYNAKGMGHLYYITNKFLSFILKDQAYPEGNKLKFIHLLLNILILSYILIVCLWASVFVSSVIRIELN